nr:DUF559 domain-containing protein [Mesorhizobium sp. B2-8-5]
MPHTPLPPKHRANARSMRKVMTGAELKLWNELRAHRLMGLEQFQEKCERFSVRNCVKSES